MGWVGVPFRARGRGIDVEAASRAAVGRELWLGHRIAGVDRALMDGPWRASFLARRYRSYVCAVAQTRQSTGAKILLTVPEQQDKEIHAYLLHCYRAWRKVAVAQRL